MPDSHTIDDVFDASSPYYNGALQFASTLPSPTNPYAGDSAYMLSTGEVVMKEVQVGGPTLQYKVGNAGIYTFGDGSDSDALFANQGTAPTGTTKTDNTNGATIYRLDRDVYYTTLTLDATVTINTNGYRIFCSTSCTINGTISRSGNNGTNGTTSSGSRAAGGAGGAALADGYLKGSAAGGTGGYGGWSTDNGENGVSGTSTANALDTDNGQDGGHGGNSNTIQTGGTGGTGGTTTPANVKLIANWHLATLLDISATGSTVKFNTTASAGGGGGGGAKAGEGGGSGGGAGSGGGIACIYAKTITIGAAGIIRANGGNGGNGGDASTATSGVGGGGSAGNGGIVVLVYNQLTNSGSVTATAGTKGTKGSSGFTTAATDGADGAAGIIYQFQLSL